jgi:DNA-binding IclR family transcriptional regulator
MAPRDELQTLKRGLQALAILHTEGPSNVACIARRLDVPRANAHRIINTLTVEGYCRKIPNSHLYIADIQSGDFLSNASVTGIITAASIEVIEDLSKSTKWPLALSMPQGPTMISRLATHLANPLALAKITPGHVQSMLEAATGIVYLAGVDDQTREAALGEVATAYPTAFAIWEPYFPRVFATVRDEGYFIMRRTGPEASLGVPVMLDGRPVAGIAMRYMKSCVSRANAVESDLPRLREAAEEIEARLGAALLHRPLPKAEHPSTSLRALTWTPPVVTAKIAPPCARTVPALQSLS